MTVVTRHVGVEKDSGELSRDFELFVQLHSASLLGTAFLMTGDLHSAEDLLQATLTMLYPKWKQVALADIPVAYVRRSLTNTFLSRQRTKAGNELTLWDMPDHMSSEDLADQVAARHDLWLLLQKLSDKQRSAVVLRYFHDLPDNEIASAIGCRSSTVRSLISRAIIALSRQADERFISDRREVGR